MQMSAEDSILIASRPIVRTDLRTNSTSTSEAYLCGNDIRVSATIGVDTTSRRKRTLSIPPTLVQHSSRSPTDK